MKQQRGFTLIELLITVIVIFIVTLVMSPILNSLLTAQRSAYVEKHRLNNQLIVGSLQSYAANATANGRLPAPYSGGGYTQTVFNGSDASVQGTALSQALSQSGINPTEINDDGTTAHKVRVYQLVQGLTLQLPLYFQSGPLVLLNYEFGAVYMTACTKDASSCNPSPVTGIPGASAVMSAANYPTWAADPADGPAMFVSSLPIQKQMLSTTVQRLDKIRDTLLSYMRTQQVTVAGGDKTNWFPNQAGIAAPGSLTGATPATNQGCRDGWYDLSSGGVLVLQTVGLAPEEFGRTAWGGSIQYCRDYDPTAVSGANLPPHYAAIRVLSNLSTGSAPDPAVPGNNIVLTF